ncbi:MAG TPA: hypothetical protein DCZ08_03580 [Anaerolineaceae bacterium]|nr:hypothetical protein [Anaerolineaceae bacterium]
MSVEILENTLNQNGLRWMHLAQMGAPVEAAPWLARVPHYSRPLVETQHQVERGLDLHHLRLWWPARELVAIHNGPAWLEGRQALLWMVDKNQTLREAICYAGIAYVDLVCRWPTAALVQSIPNGATDTVMVYADADEQIAVRLESLPELPRGYILMVERAK